VEYEDGQKVWLNVKNSILFEGLTPKFMIKYTRPYVIVKWLFEDVYELELSPKIQLHPTFHVSILNPYHEDTLRLEYKQVLWVALDLVGDYFEYKVEGILKRKNTEKGGKENLLIWLCS